MSPTILDLESWSLNLPMPFFMAFIVLPLLFGLLRLASMRPSGLTKVFGKLQRVDEVSDGVFLYTIKGSSGEDHLVTGRFARGNRLSVGRWMAALAKSDESGNLVMLQSAQSLRMLKITSDGYKYGLIRMSLKNMCMHNVIGFGRVGRSFYRVMNVGPALAIAVAPLFAVPYLDYKMRENRADVRNLGYSMLERDIAEGRILSDSEAAGLQRTYIWLEDNSAPRTDRYFRLATLGISQLAWSITEANRIESGVYGRSYRAEENPIRNNHQIIAVLTRDKNVPLMHCGYEDGLLKRSGSLIHSEVDYSLLAETSGLHALCPPSYEPAGDVRPMSFYLEIFGDVNTFMMEDSFTPKEPLGVEI